MIQVISRRAGGTRCTLSDATIVYIGKGTPLGNKFYLSDINDDRERATVIGKYTAWFYNAIQKGNMEVKNEMNRLYQIAKVGNLALECWCAPKACHGDVIKKLLDQNL